MKLATTSRIVAQLTAEEQFEITGPSAHSGSIVRARISRVRIDLEADGSIRWRLFGRKLKKDGTPSEVGYEYSEMNAEEGWGVWKQISLQLRAKLPHGPAITARYEDQKSGIDTLGELLDFG